MAEKEESEISIWFMPNFFFMYYNKTILYS